MHTNAAETKIQNASSHTHTAGTPTIDELRKRVEARHNEEMKKEKSRKRRRRSL